MVIQPGSPLSLSNGDISNFREGDSLALYSLIFFRVGELLWPSCCCGRAAPGGAGVEVAGVRSRGSPAVRVEGRRPESRCGSSRRSLGAEMRWVEEVMWEFAGRG